MKRVLSCIIMIVLLVTIGIGASADIANAHVDDFYWRNSSKFNYSVNGMYYVDSEDGYVTAWTSPSGTKMVKNIANGTLVYVMAEYRGWATSVYLADDKYHVDGNMWFPLEQLTPRYDTDDFYREYRSQIDLNTEYTDFLDRYNVKEKLCFYSFPGSGECSEILWLEELNETPQLKWTFTDAQGRHWCYCESFGYREIGAWLCIEEPENMEMQVTLKKEPVLKAEPVDIQEELPALRYESVVSGMVYALYAGLGTAVIGAAVLIYSLRRRRKNTAAAQERQAETVNSEQ